MASARNLIYLPELANSNLMKKHPIPKSENSAATLPLYEPRDIPDCHRYPLIKPACL
jgi:hypothetical protein